MYEYLALVKPGSNDYLLRILFDTTFYVWTGILLLNVVTGLMVDTFGAVREEKERRTQIKENSCFVCGLDRSRYEDLGLKNNSFQQHVDANVGEHAVWQYVYFLAYLKDKNVNKFSGIEQYVYNQLPKNGSAFKLDWLPSRSSFIMELYNKSVKVVDRETLKNAESNQDDNGD